MDKQKHAKKQKKKIEVTPIEDKMSKNRFRLLGYVQQRALSTVVKINEVDKSTRPRGNQRESNRDN